MRTLALIVVLAVPSVVGCAATSAAGSSSGGSGSRITAEEIAEIDPEGMDALQAIRRLRPNWLTLRGRTMQGANAPRVVVDGIEYGEIPSLQSIDISEVLEIRFLTGGDATTRFGTGYPGGVILVSTR